MGDVSEWMPQGVWLVVSAWAILFVMTIALGSKNTITISFLGFFLAVIMYGRPPTPPAE